MKGLTKRQREIIDFIETYLREKRHSPSYRDIQRHFGFSSLGSVYNHVQSLKKKGVLPEHTSQGRSLSIISPQYAEGIEIPLIGKLRGGMPIETYPQVSTLLLPTHMAPFPSACYVIRIVGAELEEEWILEGDLIVVHSKSAFVDGDTVLAQVGGQTTFIKRCFLESPYLRLESANPEVRPMILRQDHVQILGIVLSLIRNFQSTSS